MRKEERVKDLKVENGGSVKEESHEFITLFKNGGFVLIHSFCFIEGFRSERMEEKKSGGPFFKKLQTGMLALFASLTLLHTNFTVNRSTEILKFYLFLLKLNFVLLLKCTNLNLFVHCWQMMVVVTVNNSDWCIDLLRWCWQMMVVVTSILW